MRNEMIGAVVRRAIEHPEFREALVKDPAAALNEHGFALEEPEFREIQRMGRDLQAQDVEQKLITLAEKYGVGPLTKGERPKQRKG